jgi:hypothetical protein
MRSCQCRTRSGSSQSASVWPFAFDESERIGRPTVSVLGDTLFRSRASEPIMRRSHRNTYAVSFAMLRIDTLVMQSFLNSIF